MRFAYADPPYPGQAKRWYGNHPDYAGEVDHAELIERLCRDYPDGWALSTGMVMLQGVLALCPDDVAIAVWHNTNSQPPGAAKWRWCYSWEAVIVRGGRPAPTVRNLLSASGLKGTAALRCGIESFPGGKPPAFTRWVANLLGARPDDQIDDLFPGSGAVARELAYWRNQPFLEQISEPRAAAQETLL
jgi:hypothetical protein